MIGCYQVETTLDLPLFRRGKVRDTYDLGDRLLMVATDRLSAFDVILPTAVPGKGVILTQLSRFWFEETASLVKSHFVTATPEPAELKLDIHMPASLAGRTMLVRKADRIDVECVMRGYLAGSGWTEYRRNGTLGGQRLPAGMVQAQRLDEPVFTPAIKSDGGHDINIDRAKLRELVGRPVADQLEAVSGVLYQAGTQRAADCGLVLADTKFEFGFIDGELAVIDEMLTPDSSRFWDAATYCEGGEQASFDKQFVRDWLIESGWNREPPGPELPPAIVQGTIARYQEAYRRLTGATDLDLPGTDIRMDGSR